MEYLSKTLGLTVKQRDMIVKNTHMAAQILRSNCLSNKLIFNLEPEKNFMQGHVKSVKQAYEL
jgi:hypothetical protein